jgi:hypothetical protein
MNWIRIVDSRKPDDDEQVLVWIGSFSLADYRDGKFWWGQCVLGGVTHWARPEGPKE